MALIGIDPTRGTLRLGSHADLVLDGAALNDLILAGCVSVTGTGKAARFTAIDARRAEAASALDAASAGALARLAGRKPTKPAAAVQRLTKGLRRAAYDDLVARGLVSRQDSTVLWVFPRSRYTLLPGSGHEQLTAAVRAVLLGESTPDEQTGTLAALLNAGQVVGKFVPKDRHREAKKRAKTLAEGEWASEAVRAAVQAADAAVTVAVIAASSAAAGGASS